MDAEPIQPYPSLTFIKWLNNLWKSPWSYVDSLTRKQVINTIVTNLWGSILFLIDLSHGQCAL
ncbi:hypothetical protein AAG906_004775 [Vitis piasezkii]